MIKRKKLMNRTHVVGDNPPMPKSDNFIILIYCQYVNKASSAKKKLLELGYDKIVSQKEISSIVSNILTHSPNVIIISHTASVKPELLDYLNLVREFSSVPIIIWGIGLPKKMENLFLKIKKVYILSETDGISSLNDLLWRIKMMGANPELWL